MTLYMLSVYVGTTMIDSNENLSSFNIIQRYTAKDIIYGLTREVIKRTNEDTIATITHGDFACHIRTVSDKTAIAVTSADYPDYIAHTCIKELFDPVNHCALQFEKYAHYENKIDVIKKDLDETIVVLHKTMENLLIRGEKLEDLIEKSEELSAQSKSFLIKSKKMNSCCVIL